MNNLGEGEFSLKFYLEYHRFLTSVARYLTLGSTGHAFLPA
jgi:hypothetical protein